MRKAQVTIFIIVGVLLLFGAIFFFMISNSLKTDELRSQANRINSDKLNQESVRIFVNDCLQDSLEEGLQRIGEQGTLWNSDVVGGVEFNENNGILTPTDQGERQVFFGIKKQDIEPSQYPCIEEGEVCTYPYPQTSGVQFGDRQRGISPSQIKGNLRRYMTQRVLECVKDWQQEELEDATNLLVEDEKILIYFTKDGLSVDADIPISVTLSGEDYFQLSQFDFFYPTEFANFVSVALHPMLLDQKYVGFEFSEEVVKGDATFVAPVPLGDPYTCVDGENGFDCSYAVSPDWGRLGIEIEKRVHPNDPSVELYEFTSQNVRPIEGEYVFRFARQNRPPALDYVHQNACPGDFDYLVIPGDANLGGLNIELSANDPDEDESMSYRIEGSDANSGKFYERLDDDVSDNRFVVENVDEAYQGRYTLNLQTQDDHGEIDEQELTILIDRPLTLETSFDIPGYMFKDNAGNLVPYSEFMQGKNEYWLSKEDPAMLKLTLPENSEHVTSSKFSISYEEEASAFAIENIEREEFWFPWGKASLSEYDKPVNVGGDLINVWSDFLDPTQSPIGHDSIRGTEFVDVSFRERTFPIAELNLAFEGAYCEQQNVNSPKTSRISVFDCLPHVNPDHPYPYPNHNIRADGTQQNINPFLATHACCDQFGQIYDREDNVVCFEEASSETCQGPAGSEGAYLKSTAGTVYYCNGKRGNVCNMDSPELKDLEQTTICGTQEMGCSSNSACYGKEQWTLQFGENALWCGGSFGCGKQNDEQSVCTTELVDSDQNGLLDNLEDKTIEEQKEILRSAQATCGCTEPFLSCFNLANGELGRCRLNDDEPGDNRGFGTSAIGDGDWVCS